MGKPITPRPMKATFMRADPLLQMRWRCAPPRARPQPHVGRQPHLNRAASPCRLWVTLKDDAMAIGGEAPILIKKVKKGGAHAHHGGAWKVAYADFVTAM